MASLLDIQQALLNAAEARLGNTVREYGTLGGQWSYDALSRALQTAPGVYASFVGGKPSGAPGYIGGEFAVYCVNKAALEPQRRAGTARVIGADEMALNLAAVLDRMLIPGVGSVRLQSIDNLFSEAMFELGGAVYGLRLALPGMALPPAEQDSELRPLDTSGVYVQYDARIRTTEETDKWLAEDYETSAPDACDQIDFDN